MVLWVPDGAWKGFPDRKNLTCDHWQSNFLFLSSSLGKKWLARIVTSLSPYSRKLSLSLAAKGDQRWQRLRSHQENFQGDLWCYLSRHWHICPRGFPVACQYRCRASDNRRCSWRSECLPVVCLKVGWLVVFKFVKVEMARLTAGLIIEKWKLPAWNCLERHERTGRMALRI